MELKTMNVIKIDGKEYLFDDLPKEQRKDLVIKLHETAMAASGFHRVKKKESDQMEFKIVNLIKIDGKEYLFDDLPKEQRKDLVIKLHETAMAAAGFRRVKKKEAAG